MCEFCSFYSQVICARAMRIARNKAGFQLLVFMGTVHSFANTILTQSAAAITFTSRRDEQKASTTHQY